MALCYGATSELQVVTDPTIATILSYAQTATVEDCVFENNAATFVRARGGTLQLHLGFIVYSRASFFALGASSCRKEVRFMW
jgi:hypothetical protein